MKADDADQSEGEAFRLPAISRVQKPRVKDAKKVRDLIKSGARELRHRLEQYAAIADSYDRIPLDTDAELRADGLGWTTNVNWGGMEAGIDGAKGPLYNLLTEPRPFVSYKSDADIPQKASQLEALATIDADILEDWEDWIYVAQLMLHNRVANGLGLFHWPTPHGWHFRSLHPGNLITPERAPLNPGLWPWAAVRTEFMLTDLISHLGSADDAKDKGWNIPQIKKAINAYKAGAGKNWPYDEDLEAIIHGFARSGSWAKFDNSISINGYILYNREWDGTISEHWLTDQDEVGFLFTRKEVLPAMERAISIFPHTLGDGFLNRVRGYGTKMLPYHDTEDRTLNHMIDVATLSSNINLTGDRDDISRLAEIVVGPITLIPDEFQFNQVSFADSSGAMAAVRREILQQRAGNKQVFGGSLDTSPNVDKTATGAKMRYQEESKMAGFEVGRYYQQLSRFHRTRHERLVDKNMSKDDPGYDSQQEYFERAAAIGLDKKTVITVKKVKARTMFGDGDPVNMFIALMDLREFVGGLPEEGKRLYNKMVFSARLRNSDLAEELLGQAGLSDYDSAQRRIAQIENGIFQVSDARVDVAGNDNTIIHTGEHTVFAEDTLQQLTEGLISEETAYATLRRCNVHVVEHMKRLALDAYAESIFEDFNRRWANIENTIRQLEQRLAAKRQSEQEQQLEELRFPQPSVKDIEISKTEKLKRDTLKAESDAKIEIMRKEAEAKVQSIAKTAETDRVAAASKQ